jgi:hypothetical protein
LAKVAKQRQVARRVTATGVAMQKTFQGLFKTKTQLCRPRSGVSPLAILAWIGLLLLTGGCASLFGARAAPAPAEPGTVLLSDDFSEELNGWGVWNREGGSVDYYQEGLRIIINETQFDYWSVAGRNFGDVQVEVDATKMAGPDDNDYGIICRYMDKNNFYLLVISSDGYYGIAKVKMGQYSMIGADQLQYSSAIVQGSSQNHLRADCIGSTLRLYANDQMLFEAEDGDFPSGDVGLLAGAYNENGVDILFDNFVVTKP